MDDSLRRDGVDGDAGIEDAVTNGMIEDMTARDTGGPNVMLEGDGSPLVDLADECGPTEPIDSSLRCLESTPLWRGSWHSVWLPKLPLLVVLSSWTNLGRLPSGCTLASTLVLHDKVEYLKSRNSWL